MNIKHFLFFIPVIFFFGCGEQETPEPQPTEEWNTYMSKDGLAANEVNVVFIDSDNNKWFGTEFGLSKYNGAEWSNFSTSNGLVYQNVLAIAEDQFGVMWIGTPFGVSRFDESTWMTYTQTDGLTDNYVYDIAIDQNNTKWFATANGVSSFDGTTWRAYFKQSDTTLVHNHVKNVEVDGNGNLWFGTEFGISKKEPAGWTSYISNNGNLWNYIVDMDVEPVTNTIWFSTLAGASSLDSQGNWNYITYGDGIAFNQIYGVAFDGNNTWFATQRGASLLKGDEWTTFTEEDGLGANWVTDVEVDNNGIAWFATNPGGVSSVKLLTP